MNFKGKYEHIIETTIGRYQSGGILAGDIVKINKKALNHPKLKEMGDNVKGNIQMLMDTDLHITVVGIRSTRDSRGEMSDGLGLSSTTSPADLYADVAVLHSPGFRGDPITLPIEVLEKQDFGGSLPPTPDSQKRIGNINIKPEEVGSYDNQRGDKYQNPTKNTKIAEDIEDIYANMNNQTDVEQVTVRVPIKDCAEIKDIFDAVGVTYSLIGPDRYELHGTLDNIQQALNQATNINDADSAIEIEYVNAGDLGGMGATQQIPNESGIPDDNDGIIPAKKDNNLEEAYTRIVSGMDKMEGFIIEIPNAFADNVQTYLAQEGINNVASVNGNKTCIEIFTISNKETIEEALKNNVMGDLTYLKVFKSDQQLRETKRN